MRKPTLGKGKLKRQIMGRVNSVGFELRKRRASRYETYIVIEVRMDRDMTPEEAEEKVEKFSKELLNQSVVVFAP